MSRLFFVDCTVAPSAAAHHFRVGLRIKARRESVPTPCTRMRTVRSPLIFRVLEVTPVGAVPACSSIRAALVW